jgi:hypothetical protein
VLAVVVFAIGWEMNSHGHQYPWYYHNDEPSKVRQVEEGWRNFRHPPLMIEVVSLWHGWTGGVRDAQATVERGRRASAFYTSAAVVLMADAAFLLAGAWAAVAVGAVLLCHGPSFEAAHYFKEDALLLLGLAMVWHALVSLHRGPGWRTGLWMLAALLVFTGSKWVAWALFPWMAWSAWNALENEPVLRKRLLWGFAAGWAVMGWRYVVEWRVFFTSSHEEWKALFVGDYAAGMQVPHALYFSQISGELGWPLVLGGTLAYAAACVWARWPAGWIPMLAAGGGLGLLAFSSKYSERYLLPISWLLMWMVIVGVAWWVLRRYPFGTRTGLWWGRSAVSVLALGWCVSLLPDWRSRWEGFSGDSRASLQNWMANQVTDDWVMARDELSRVDPPPGRPMIESFFVADLGSVDEMRARGVSHVVVSCDVYHRYVDGSASPTLRMDPIFQSRASFYRELFKQGRVVWFEPVSHPKSLHPGLAVVEIGRKRDPAGSNGVAHHPPDDHSLTVE